MTRAAILALALLTLASCVRVEIRPEDSLTAEEHYSLGAIYESKGELDLALREYEKAMDEDYPGVAAYFASGNVLVKKKNYDEAEKMYLKALDIEPENALVLNNLGFLLMETGRLEEARSSVEKAVVSDPARAHIYLDTLGLVGMKERKYEEAEVDFLKALKSAPPDGPARENILTHLLELYRASGDGEKAQGIEKELEKSGGQK